MKTKNIIENYFKKEYDSLQKEIENRGLEKKILTLINQTKQKESYYDEKKPLFNFRFFSPQYAYAFLLIIVIIGAYLLAGRSLLFPANKSLITSNTANLTKTPTPTGEKLSPAISIPPNNVKNGPKEIALSIDQLKQGRKLSAGSIQQKNKMEANVIENIKSININDVQSYAPRFLSKLFTPIFAEDTNTIEMPKIIFQNLTEEKQKNLEQQFGFTTPPQRPDQYNMNYLLWDENGRYMLIDPNGGNQLTYFDSSVNSNSLPTAEEAQQIALNFVQSKSLLPLEYEVRVDNNDRFYGFYKAVNIPNSLYKGRLVEFIAKHNGSPVSFGDLGASLINNDIAVKPMIEVYVGEGGKVGYLTYINYLFRLEKNSQLYQKKDLNQAVADLKQSGGVVTWLRTYDQPTGSYSSNNRARIKDAEINQVKLAYYYNYYLPSYRYIKDVNSYQTAYLTPVWLFSGTGTTVMTDGNNQFDVKTDFVSLVYAVTANKDQRIFKLSTFDLKKTLDNKINASIVFSYDLPQFLNWSAPHTRQGLKYEMLILYPDNTYLELTDIIYSADGDEEFTFPQKVNSGQIKIVVTLPDFPALVEERNINL